MHWKRSLRKKNVRCLLLLVGQQARKCRALWRQWRRRRDGATVLMIDETCADHMQLVVAGARREQRRRHVWRLACCRRRRLCGGCGCARLRPVPAPCLRSSQQQLCPFQAIFPRENIRENIRVGAGGKSRFCPKHAPPQTTTTNALPTLFTARVGAREARSKKMRVCARRRRGARAEPPRQKPIL